MKWIKIALAVLAGVWLLAMILLGAGGTWLVRNQDTVADAVMDASGISEEIANAKTARCDLARERMQAMWDRAVDANMLDQHSEAIDQAESEMKVACAAK